MAASESACSTIEKWRTKGFELSLRTSDVIVPVMLRGFDAMAAVNRKGADQLRLDRLLCSMDHERRLSLSYDDCSDPIRELMYGFIEALWLTLKGVSEERRGEEGGRRREDEGGGGGRAGERAAGGKDAQLNESVLMDVLAPPVAQSTPTPFEQPIYSFIDTSIIKPEEVDDFAAPDSTLYDLQQPLKPVVSAVPIDGDEGVMDDESPIEPAVTEEPKEMEEVEAESSSVAGSAERTRRVESGEEQEMDGKEDEEVEELVEEEEKESIGEKKEEEEGFGEEERVMMEEEEEEGVVVKTEKKEKVSRRMTEVPLVCPLCPADSSFCTPFFHTFNGHLRKVHHTTMGKACLWFLCDCGFVSRNDQHKIDFKECSGVNTKVARSRELAAMTEEEREAVWRRGDSMRREYARQPRWPGVTDLEGNMLPPILRVPRSKRSKVESDAEEEEEMEQKPLGSSTRRSSRHAPVNYAEPEEDGEEDRIPLAHLKKKMDGVRVKERKKG